MKKILYTALLFIPFLVSCEPDKNHEAEIITYSVENADAIVTLDDVKRSINLNFPETVTSAKDIIAEFSLSPGATASIGSVEQISGITPNNYEGGLQYKIQSEDEEIVNLWSVTATNNAYTSNWGLGGFLSLSLSHDKTYEWYIDQKNTGTYSDVNCGPTSTIMASKWSDSSFDKTVEDARMTYHPDGGWWYTNNLFDYLGENGIPRYYIALGETEGSTKEAILEELEAGKILILCLDMYYIRYNSSSTEKVDKYYQTNSTGWGHFIVLKGYKKVNNVVFFETYDPNSWGSKYADGTYRGKGRYYRASDIYSATNVWWKYAIVVSEKGKELKKSMSFIENNESVPIQKGK